MEEKPARDRTDIYQVISTKEKEDVGNTRKTSTARKSIANKVSKERRIDSAVSSITAVVSFYAHNQISTEDHSSKM